MMLFYQMYRLAAEPFFLSNFKKSDFVQMNAAALKYYVMASMLIFLGIALFRDLFALIVGRDFPRRVLHPPGRARGQRADGRVAQPRSGINAKRKPRWRSSLREPGSSP